MPGKKYLNRYQINRLASDDGYWRTGMKFSAQQKRTFKMHLSTNTNHKILFSTHPYRTKLFHLCTYMDHFDLCK